MIYLFLISIISLLVYAPQLWIRFVIKKHSAELSQLPGTGGELAEHLIRHFGIKDVGVEKTQANQDHYSPEDKKVRLSPNVYDGRSLSAIAIAAHEVGHAIQFFRQDKVTQLGNRFMPLAMIIEKISIGIMFAIPVVTAILKVPHAAVLTALVGVIGMLASVLFQLMVLPMEWDASFNKAMPILIKGEYISEEQVPAIRSVLRAAAFTYVAAALANILSLWRWLAILRGAIR